MNKWYVYLIQSQKDNSIYTGIALDVQDRLNKHNCNKGAKYTKGRGPFVLLKQFQVSTKSEALKLEAKIKKLSKQQKLNLKESMKNNFCSINVILDSSGSMGNLSSKTIESFNSFLNEQKLIPGEAVFTLCTFNDEIELVHNFANLQEVKDLTTDSYLCRGTTALLDAIGITMQSTGTKLASLTEEERPDKVLFLIITDGHENSSNEFNAVKIKEMIKHQKEKYSWEFMFFGASLDQIADGVSLGIDRSKTLSYVPTFQGVDNLYRSISNSTTDYRTK